MKRGPNDLDEIIDRLKKENKKGALRGTFSIKIILMIRGFLNLLLGSIRRIPDATFSLRNGS